MTRILALLLLAAIGPDWSPVQINGTPAGGCTAPEYRQFDFWVGNWDAYEATGSTKVVARTLVTPMLGGCVLGEVYQQNDGLVGESYSIYDSSRKQWHQSWVTNRGGLLLLDGWLEEGRMVLIGREHRPDGTSSLIRGVWWPEGDAVRERADRSTDGGKTWTPVFDLVFRPHRAA
jgi:hypothetical protein